jgi:hypothetical protein
MMNFLKNLLIVLFIFVFSCKREEEIDPCILNPTENNATLKRMIALEIKHNIDSCSINLVTKFDNISKKNNYFFVVTNSSPILKYHFIKNAQIINCAGADIAEYYTKEVYEEFFKEAKFVKQVWKKERNKPIESIGSCGTLTPMTVLPYFKNLKLNLEKYAWRSLIYQYNYKGKTLYYGLYTRIDQEGQKLANVAAMDCEGNNQQDSPTWDQKDFLENAILERQIY